MIIKTHKPHLNEPALLVKVLYTYTLPEKVDVWVVAVLSLSGVSSREGTKEGVCKQTGHLLLRHGDGVVHASFQEGDRLEEKKGYNRRRTKLFVEPM